MRDRQREGQRWLSQAENDYEYALLGLKDGYYAQACFIFQQVAEKAVKAVLYYRGERRVLGHSVFELLKELGIDTKELLESAALLDQHYIPTRYPNGLPGGVPYEVYTKQQAEAAEKSSATILSYARNQLKQEKTGVPSQ